MLCYQGWMSASGISVLVLHTGQRKVFKDSFFSCLLWTTLLPPNRVHKMLASCLTIQCWGCISASVSNLHIWIIVMDGILSASCILTSTTCLLLFMNVWAIFLIPCAGSKSLFSLRAENNYPVLTQLHSMSFLIN